MNLGGRKPPKKNTIVYDVYDDEGNIKYPVLQMADNVSERERIHEKYSEAIIPDKDIHIVCPRCVVDFGVALCSKTVTGNRDLIRKNKAGTGPHDSYVDHLRERKCVVNTAARGIDVPFEELLANCTLPQRNKNKGDAGNKPSTSRKPKKPKATRSGTSSTVPAIIGDFRFPVITKDIVSFMRRSARDDRGPLHAVLVRWHDARDMDAEFWLHRVLQPTIRAVYFNNPANRVILFSHQRIMFRTFTDTDVHWSDDGPSIWKTIEITDEARGLKTLKCDIMRTLEPVISAIARIHMIEVGKLTNKPVAKQMYEKRAQFLDFVKEEFCKVFIAATPTQIFDMFVETSPDILNTFKIHGAPLIADTQESEDDTDDPFAQSDSESTIVRDVENGGTAPAAKTDPSVTPPATTGDTDKKHIATPLSPLEVMHKIWGVYSTFDHIPESVPDLPDDMSAYIDTQSREQFQDGIDDMVSKYKDYIDAHDNARPDMDAFRALLEGDTISVWEGLLPAIYKWLEAVVVIAEPPASQPAAVEASSSRKGGRGGKRARSTEPDTVDNKARVTRQKLSAVKEQ